MWGTSRSRSPSTCDRPTRSPSISAPQTERSIRVLFLFLDGVGIGEDDPDLNPFITAELPTLRGLTGQVPTLSRGRIERSDGPTEPIGTATEPDRVSDTLDEGSRERLGAERERRRSDVPREVAAFPLDATLGVEGKPQSGTGQTALLTGLNAAEMFGRHFGPWTPVALRPVLERESVLQRALDRSHDVAFANAYPRSWPGLRAARRLAAVPLAAMTTGLLTRHQEHLIARDAVASGIVNDGWIEALGFTDVPRITPPEAGHALATVSRSADLVMFAHYATDHAGHHGGMTGGRAALETVDAFLGGVLEHLDHDTLVLLASDHGNIEDVSGGHTRNPALGMLIGPDAIRRSASLESLMDVPAAVLRWLAEGSTQHPA